jgi:iron complex transport system substrate-binding protein
LPTKRFRSRIRRKASSAGAILWALGHFTQLACGPAADSTVSQRAEALVDAPSVARNRIVSLSAVATEFVVALGAGHQIVGVDAHSQSLPGLERIPVVDLQSAREVAPDLVIAAEFPLASDTVSQLKSEGTRLEEFAPHDIEDVFALCRGLGADLAGVAAATQLERRISRPLGIVGGSSPAFDRPHVLPIVEIEPFMLAGGHSFETDLIEIAGGTSLTHGGDDNRRPMSSDQWDALAPDLVLYMTLAPSTAEQRISIRKAVPERFAIEFFAFARDTFWLHEPSEDAKRLRTIIKKYESRVSKKDE